MGVSGGGVGGLYSMYIFSSEKNLFNNLYNTAMGL